MYVNLCFVLELFVTVFLFHLECIELSYLWTLRNIDFILFDYLMMYTFLVSNTILESIWYTSLTIRQLRPKKIYLKYNRYQYLSAEPKIFL